MEAITALDNRNVIMPFMNFVPMLYPCSFRYAMAIACIKVKNCFNLSNMSRMLKAN